MPGSKLEEKGILGYFQIFSLKKMSVFVTITGDVTQFVIHTRHSPGDGNFTGKLVKHALQAYLCVNPEPDKNVQYKLLLSVI